MKRVLVVGGGIGGLTTAIALRRVGAEVSLIERSPAFTQVGAGITVQVNANAVLQALGVHLDKEDVISIGKFEMLNGKGQRVMSGDSDKMPYEYPSLNIHRADLHKNLLRVAEGIPMRTGIALEELQTAPDNKSVTVKLSDGSQEEWDVVVGADGSHSTVRRLLLGEGGSATRYSGQTCWRFACDAKGKVPDITVERWRSKQRAGVVPLSRDRVYVYMVLNAPQGTPEPGSNSLEQMRKHFGGWNEPLDTILELVTDEVPIHHGDLIEHKQVHYGRDNVVLLGDAAHAMTPNLGQGAGMAIEDAGMLALLWKNGSKQLAQDLSKARHKRSNNIKVMSWRVGSMAHWRSSIACWLRDLLLRSMSKSNAEKQAAALWQPGLDIAQRLRSELS